MRLFVIPWTSTMLPLKRLVGQGGAGWRYSSVHGCLRVDTAVRGLLRLYSWRSPSWRARDGPLGWVGVIENQEYDE